MAIKNFCDVCGKEVESKDYHMLEIRETILIGDFSPDIVDGIEGHKACIESVKELLDDVLSKCRA